VDIFVKSRSIYIKPTPRWSTAHSTHIVWHAKQTVTFMVHVFFSFFCE